MLKKVLLLLIIVVIAVLTYVGVSHWKHSGDNRQPTFTGRQAT